MSRADIAKEYFLKGYACSQAVLLAFSDVAGLDKETAEKISLPFGGGMGRLRLTCGAVSGMEMALGLALGRTGTDPADKRAVYAAVQETAKRFGKENGSLLCGELLSGAGVAAGTDSLPEKRSDEYLKKRPCAQLVYSAAEILESYFEEKGII